MKKTLLLIAMLTACTADTEVVDPDPAPACTPVPHETCGLAPARPGYIVEMLDGQARMPEAMWAELDTWILDTAAWRDCVEGR